MPFTIFPGHKYATNPHEPTFDLGSPQSLKSTLNYAQNSAFYKYKDTIFPIQDVKRQSILSLSIDVDDIPGILGKILSVVNEEKCSVLTIHQTVPINAKATIIISLELSSGDINIEKLNKRIKDLEFVNSIKVIGLSM